MMISNQDSFWMYLTSLIPVTNMCFHYDENDKKVKCHHCTWQVDCLPSEVDKILNIHNAASPDCPLSKGDVEMETQEVVEFMQRLPKNSTCPMDVDMHTTSPMPDSKHLFEAFRNINTNPHNVAANCELRHVVLNAQAIKPVGGATMLDETSRLQTFANNWPAESLVSTEDLAKAGFMFRDTPDRVMCVFCRGVLHTWKYGDIPMREHRKAFPTCPFILDLDVGNVPYDKKIDRQPFLDHAPHDIFCWVDSGYGKERANVSNSVIMHPEYSDETIRRITFKTWKKREISVEKLINCGFFSTGKGDSVKCFCCALELKNWNATEDIVAKHLRLKPTCKYVNIMRDGSIFRRPTGATIVSQSSASEVGNRYSEADVNTRMESWVVQKVVEMGYPVDLIRHLVRQQLLLRGEDFLVTDQLVEAACAAQLDMEARGLNHSEVGRWIEMLQSEERRLSEQASTSANASVPVESSGAANVPMEGLDLEELGIQNLENIKNIDAQSQRRINDELRGFQMCKICMDRQINILFLPCKHYVCCVQCAPEIRVCPLCRAPIRSRFRTASTEDA